MLFAQFDEAVGEVERGDAFHRGKTDPASHTAAAALHVFPHGDHGALDALGMAEQAVAGLVDLQSGRQSLEQRHAQACSRDARCGD